MQTNLPDTRLVKAFNNITSASLGNGARATGAADRNALPIAGEDADAKQQVTALFDVLGYDAVDIGGLADSWRVEPGTPAYCDPSMPAWPTEKLSFDELLGWLRRPGHPDVEGRVERAGLLRRARPGRGLLPRHSLTPLGPPLGCVGGLASRPARRRPSSQRGASNNNLVPDQFVSRNPSIRIGRDQFAFDQLPGRRARELVDEVDGAGCLVVSDPGTDEVDELGRQLP